MRLTPVLLPTRTHCWHRLWKRPDKLNSTGSWYALLNWFELIIPSSNTYLCPCSVMLLLPCWPLCCWHILCLCVSFVICLWRSSTSIVKDAWSCDYATMPPLCCTLLKIVKIQPRNRALDFVWFCCTISISMIVTSLLISVCDTNVACILWVCTICKMCYATCLGLELGLG